MRKLSLVAIPLLLLLFPTLPISQQKPLDVPYVPTKPEVVAEMLRMANVGKDDILYDLGCGDGRILITAAQLYGTRGVGVDIDPDRIAESKANAVKSKVADRVQFFEQDLFETDIHEATVVSLYLLTSVNLRLRPKLLKELRPGTRVVSHNYGMDTWRADQSSTVFVNGTSHYVYLWIIPANVTGTWEWEAPTNLDKTRYRFEFDQHFQWPTGIAAAGNIIAPLRNIHLVGDKIQFAFDQMVSDKTVVLTFEGKVGENSMQGTLEIQGLSKTEKQAWKALRRQSTMKPMNENPR